MLTNNMHTCYVKVLIQFLVPSKCFENHMFIIRKTISYMQSLCYDFHAEITIKGYIKYRQNHKIW